MTQTTTAVQERRRFTRNEPPPHFAINLVQSDRSIHAQNVNFSEGGFCIRLEEMLEVRSLVQMELTPEGSNNGRGRVVNGGGMARASRTMKCRGRVSWVMQRLDLRNMAPFLFDTGIEFVDPSPMLRQFMARYGVDLSVLKRRTVRHKTLDAFVIRGRTYIPRLERASARPPRWHLVESVDGIACFSRHYASQRAAVMGWATFRRQQAKR